MVKELYLNEKILIKLEKEQIKVLLIEESKVFSPKELNNESYSFIKNHPNIMDNLKKGYNIESFKKNDMINSIIGTPGVNNIFEIDNHLIPISKREGYSFEGSIENLEYSLHKH